MTGLAQVASYHGNTLEFTELLCATHSFINVCRSSLHAQVPEFIHLWPCQNQCPCLSFIYLFIHSFIHTFIHCVYCNNVVSLWRLIKYYPIQLNI